MAKPLATPEERVAFFQQMFSDTIPHNKALGLKILAVRARSCLHAARMARGAGRQSRDRRAGRRAADGDARQLLRHGGGDPAQEPEPFATLDLRIDYVKPATPGQPVIAEAECYRITHSVAFTRAFAHQGDPKDPIAAAAGTFMLGTKGEVTRAQDRQGVKP